MEGYISVVNKDDELMLYLKEYPNVGDIFKLPFGQDCELEYYKVISVNEKVIIEEL